MHFSRFFLPALGLMATSVAARPTTETIESRQITSPSIIQSATFDVDVAVNTRAKIALNVDDIFKQAKANKELALVTAAKIQRQVANMVVAFTRAAYAVEGDFADSIRRIGDEEAALIKSSTDKIVQMARDMEARAEAIGKKEDKAVLVLLSSEGQAIMTSMRAIFTPIQAFVASSTEDIEFPGALKRCKDDTNQAGKELDAIVKKFTGA